MRKRLKTMEMDMVPLIYADKAFDPKVELLCMRIILTIDEAMVPNTLYHSSFPAYLWDM